MGKILLNVAEILRRRAEDSGDRTGYTFLAGDGSVTSITYGQLYSIVNKIRFQIQEKVRLGDRVVLLYPPGLAYIAGLFACFSSGVIGVPAYPPTFGRANRQLKRLQSIVADARPAIALCDVSVKASLESLAQAARQFDKLELVVTTDGNSDESSAADFITVVEADVALLQYTSGSTAEPKGVMVTHGNLMHNLEVICNAFGHSSNSRGVIWLPPYHDMGLVGGILQPLYAGFPVTLMSPATFLQRPFLWLKAISDEKATTSGGPNSAYELCIKRITEEQKQYLDLSSWDIAFNGAEPIRAETIEGFTKAFSQCGFRRRAFLPCYGLAEATLMVSGCRKPLGEPKIVYCSRRDLEQSRIELAKPDAGQGVVACGKPELSTLIRIVDPRTKRIVPSTEIGEIWIASPSVTRGYWEKREISDDVFSACLADDAKSGPYLRTGDLGFMIDGDLYVTGRLKDLIIVRGLNYYPQDIELTASISHPLLRCEIAAAFSVDFAGEESLVVVHEVDRHAAKNFLKEIAAAIRTAIMRDHEVLVHTIVLVRKGQLPKTSSGKIQRHLCRRLFVKDELEALVMDGPTSGDSEKSKSLPDLINFDSASRREFLEKYLVEVFQSMFKMDVTALEGNFDLSEIGFDSLMAVDFRHRVKRQLGADIPYSVLFENFTIQQLAKEIEKNLLTNPSDIELQSLPEVKSPYPLSYGQQALWYLYQMNPSSPAYNISVAAKISGRLDENALAEAFQDILERHESLRMKYDDRVGEPFQAPRQLSEKDFLISKSYTDSNFLEQEVKSAVRQPFNLRNESPIRLRLFRKANGEYILLWVIHHLAADFWSFSILLPELKACYLARSNGKVPKLPSPKITYGQYVHWQKQLLEGTRGGQLRDFWRAKLKSMPEFYFPGRISDEQSPSTIDSQYYQDFSLELITALRQLAREYKMTLNEVFLAAYEVLLYRYTDHEQFAIGTPSVGRSQEFFREVVGYFVNVLLLPVTLDGDKSFLALCGDVKSTLRDALDHQDFPLLFVLDNLRKSTKDAGALDIQIWYAFLKTNNLSEAASFLLKNKAGKLHWGDLLVEPYSVGVGAAQFELMLTLVEDENRIQAVWEHRPDRLDAATVQVMMSHYEVLLQSIVKSPRAPLSELSMATARERERMLVGWNNTRVDYPNVKVIHELFEEQVEKTPDAVALIFEDQSLSYQELNRRSNQQAHYLRKIGISPDILVGICLERSVEMLIGILAILKAGGAYVPLDPLCPIERLRLIAQEAKMPLILTQQRFADMLTEIGFKTLALDTHQLDTACDNLTNETAADNLAYVIYTSGSTGVPKGVMNTHRGVRNRLQWMQDAYHLTGDDRILQKTPYTFDVSVWEFFWPLLNGSCLVIARPGGHQDPDYMRRLIDSRGITTIHFVPSMLHMFLDEIKAGYCRTLKRVICSGEALSFELAQRFYQALDAELHNLYGPTEAAVDVTFWACSRNSQSRVVPIGRPIANMQIYILDSGLEPAPVGIKGEIYLGGVGLARGYLHRPELTAEKFVPNPYGSCPGDRLYRTGDIGRYLSDGNIEYIGRKDNQIKLRGFRIELGEIENCLNRHTGIRESIVVLHGLKSQDMRIVAYVVSKGKTPPSTSDLKNYVASKLPEYMVPSVIVAVEKLPLNANGKVERKALPALDLNESLTSDVKYVPPDTPAEKELVRILEEVFQRERIGVHDNFFQLGGNSLLMMRVVSRIRDIFHVDVPIARFFQEPTIAQLAKIIVEEKTGTKEVDQIAQLLDQLEHMSIEDVKVQLKQFTDKSEGPS